MDEDTKRQVLRRLPYGMYVMTAAPGGRAVGSTLTWLSQCSFRPPLVMIAVQKGSQMHSAVKEGGTIAVNLLSEDQKAIAEAFFKPGEAEEGRLAGCRCEPGPMTGAPLLTDAPAWFEARVSDAVDRGDHTVFVAEVVGAGMRDPAGKPLLLASTPWNYGG